MNPQGEQMGSEALILELSSILNPIEPCRIFRRKAPLEVELGSGDGSFLTAYAARHPERDFLGIERLLGRIRKLSRRAKQAGLSNLRAVRIESSYFLEYLLPPGSAHAIHLYFPDPWPKRKHRRHRLVNERFPWLAQRALVAGGTVFLRTDDRDYFSQMTEVFGNDAAFEFVETPEELSGISTDFERGFRARGIDTLRAAYRAR